MSGLVDVTRAPVSLEGSPAEGLASIRPWQAAGKPTLSSGDRIGPQAAAACLPGSASGTGRRTYRRAVEAQRYTHRGQLWLFPVFS